MRGLLALLFLLLSLPSTRALAERPLDVHSALSGTALGEHIGILIDEQGELDFEQVRSRSASQFAPAVQTYPAYGHTEAVFWLRLTVRNSGPSARPWLLELGYPHIDDLTLYVPDHNGAYKTRVSGDARPFGERDVAYRNFVFMLEEPASSERSYFLRVASAGSINLPLVAWSVREFVEEQHLDWAGLCVFYGVILVMTFYSVSFYLFTRERSYLVFAGSVLSMGLFQLTHSGHTFQYMVPNHPRLAQQLLPISIALGLLSSNLLKRYYLPEAELPLWYKRAFDALILYSVALTVFVCASPYRLSIRVSVLSALFVVSVAFALSLRLVRHGVSGSLVFFLAWASFWLGVVVAVMHGRGLLPRNVLTQWAGHAGMAMQLVLLSSGLASKLNRMRAELGALNGELSQKVQELEDALVRAEEATQQAETVTRVKDEFMATMSHELRTPLNTIINLPQGLVEDFPLIRYATCAGCRSTFELEPEESVHPHTPCPDCQAVGTLVFSERARYIGRPERTAHYLHKIERSGTHLLRVMNAILDDGKTEAGRFKLLRERFDLIAFVRDVLDEMADLAQRSGIELVLAAGPDRVQVFADPLRIRQVLINLLANAIKFSNGRGTVTVSVGARIDSCVVAVRDEGIGIAKEKLERVFGNFEQLHSTDQRAYGGTGLGLSISRSLVRRHGGDMWLQSELDRGSIFFFSIPHGAGVSRALPRASLAR